LPGPAYCKQADIFVEKAQNTAQGVSIFKIMDVTRDKSGDTLRGYVRAAELFMAHAGKGLL